MSYELNSIDVLAALPLGAWFVFVPFIIVGIVCYRTGLVKNCWLTGLFATALPIGILIFSIHDSIGDGWRLKGNTLELKAWLARETVAPASARISLVDAATPWLPVQRTYGYGTPGLSAGWFKLQNGESAVVFYHRTPAKMLVMRTGGQIYLIAHPGVEILHQALIARGAKEM